MPSLTACNKSNVVNKTSGFTLIETAIVILIIGIIVAAFFSAATIYLKKQKIDEIDWRMKEVRLALTNYIADNPDLDQADGDEVRFPCPAPLTSAKGDPNHAEELCPSGAITAGDDLGGVFVVQGTDAGSLVLVGAIPTETLDISEDLMLDAYGNRMTYAVTYALTQNDALLVDPIPRGQIEILSDNGTQKTDHSDFFIVSHGADGAGSYTTSGVLNGNECRTTGTAGDGDSQNCMWQTSQSAVFKDNPVFGLSTAENDQFYDDVALYTLGEAEGWWEASNSSGTDIRNRNTGNVLVTTNLGIRTSNPQAPLDVNGNAIVRGDTTLSGNTTISGVLHVENDTIIDGDLGVGTGTPSSKMEVNGDIKAGNSGSSCTGSNVGAMRYNASIDSMQFCSQLGWLTFSAPKCRTVKGNINKGGSLAQCNNDEYLLSGGGECANGRADSLCGDPLGFIHVSRPGTNSWIIDCWSRPPDPQATALNSSHGHSCNASEGNCSVGASNITFNSHTHNTAIQDVCGQAHAICCQK